jgi:energy-coupling factor transporter ATP-binding protein EcfA2
MKLSALELRNFTVFEAADFRFAPGINVFIGENATGKTHMLKVIYALLKASQARPSVEDDVRREVKERIGAIFLPGDVGHLVRDGATEPCSLHLGGDGGEIMCSLTSDGGDVSALLTPWDTPASVFLPAREALGMFPGFLALYKDREVSFDETYNDLCLALDRIPLRGDAKTAADVLASPFSAMLRGGVERRGNTFYVDIGDGFHEAQLVADGMRKVATLTYLVGNGSIKAGSILLWDEPEANLNPRLIAKLAVALRELAARGVQIFIATHDYLLSHKLSLGPEYGTEPKVEMRFFSLHRDTPTEPVVVEVADTLGKMHNNPILDEYARHHDEEQELARQELERDLAAGSR